MLGQSILHLSCGQAVSGHVHHVVHAASDADIAHFIHAGSVFCEVKPWSELAEIGGFEFLRVTVKAAGEGRRERRLNYKISALAHLHRLPARIHNLSPDPRKWPSRHSGDERSNSRQSLNTGGPGLRLPPGVDNGAALAADEFKVPKPSFLVNGLAYGAEDPERGKVVLLGPLIAPFHVHADGRGRSVVDRDLVLFDDLPHAAKIRVVRGTLINDGSDPVHERPIVEVRVAGDPAHVRGTPVDIVLVEVEVPFAGGIDLDRISAGGVHHALGFPRGARGVEDEGEVLAIEGLGRTEVLLAPNELVIPKCPSSDPWEFGVRSSGPR